MTTPEILVNKELAIIGRACDMLWMCFGKLVLITNRQGKTREVNEFSLHVQCPWRVSQNDTILFGSYDIYQPFIKENEKTPDWNWDMFNREDSDSSIFDVKSKEFNKSFLPLRVENIEIKSQGDLCIQFDKNVYFELFINSTKIEKEYWRFIDFRENSHYDYVFNKYNSLL